MKLVADLHIHSHFSRATSKNLTIPHLAIWAQKKGVHIVGTGDIAHPGWLAEMQEHLEPAEEGLFRLKKDAAEQIRDQVPAACQNEVRFMLAGEISNIYKKGGKTRKIHNVVFAPNFEAVARIQAALERIGNIRSDGRPILGLPSRDLLEIILDVDPRCHLIPAHIWTPWFALLGSKSGYDSVEECFDDLTPHIFALETGLSSDPPMNWRVSSLDRYTLVSNSDAHSPQKLAREATLFDTELSYDAIFEAMKSGDPAHFLGTIEFFPEEGKYHHDGHRKCGINWKPTITLKHDGICPVCGRPVTVGVMHRVEALADRPEGQPKPNAAPFYSLIPLPEILSELLGVGAGSKRVQREYERLLAGLGSELAILMDIPVEEIAAVGGEKLAAGIGRMREGEVTAIAGFDGEFGVIKLFDGDDEETAPQMSLFGEEVATALREPEPVYSAGAGVTQRRGGAEREQGEGRGGPRTNADEGEGASRGEETTIQPPAKPAPPEDEAADADAHPLLASLNTQQRAAVLTVDAPLIIVAGPGAGKTRTLTTRIAYLVQEKGVAPENILAITFTNKAAEEMAERLERLLAAAVASRITIKTFHAFGAMILREHAAKLGLDANFAILADEDRQALLRARHPDLSQKALAAGLGFISQAKNRLLSPDSPELDRLSSPELPNPAAGLDFRALYRSYQAALTEAAALDFDDLIFQTVRLFEMHPAALAEAQERFRWISVDEYQDINRAQYRLLRLLTANGANLCVIGDPDQAIYGFRGADRRYFLSFEQDYPDARKLHLSQNYRSVQAILDAAAQVIARNPDREAVALWSEFVEDVRLDVYQAPTERAEAEYVVHQIEQMVGGVSMFSVDSGRVDGIERGARAFGDFAVLYRLRAQSAALVEAFERLGIPYQTVGATPFFASEDVRRALAYLWLALNPGSDAHWRLAGREKQAEVERLVGLAGSASAAELAEQAARLAGLDESQTQRLYERAAHFGRDLREFLQAATLQSETDFYDPRADRVTLMTLHAAKGLEFPVVFMVGCEEGLLPYLPENRPSDVEEERRLFYVGMTRAREKLILTHARRRFLFGRRMENPRSRFVDDIETALLELKKMTPRKKKRKGPEMEQLSLF